MYKLLVVDDNQIIVDEIKTLLEWSAYDIEIVSCCYDGMQALEYIKENPVDIIISDVFMPVMNGIDLLKHLREQGYETKFLFMSCYDEFDLVKSAIDLDAIGYILKPIVKRELEELLVKVLKICKKSECAELNNKLVEQYNDSLPVMREFLFRELLFTSEYSDAVIRKKLKILKFSIPSEVEFLVGIIKVKETNNCNDIVATYSILDFIKTNAWHMTDEFNVVPIILSGNEMAIIVRLDDDSNRINIFEDIDTYCQDLFNQQIVIGISSIGKKLDELYILYLQAKEASKCRFFSTSRIVFYNDIYENKTYSDYFGNINVAQLIKEVSAVISGCDRDKAKELLEKNMICNTTNEEMHIKSFSYILLSVIEISIMDYKYDFDSIIDHKIIWNKIMDFESILDVKQWFYNVFLSIFDVIENAKANDKNNWIVSQIKEIISKKYGKRLTVEHIASLVHFSGNQANAIFKETTGMTIYDYLIDYRMNVARDLLSEPESKIYAVANAVGYQNQAHFSMLFKQKTGMSPMEYKNLVFNLNK